MDRGTKDLVGVMTQRNRNCKLKINNNRDNKIGLNPVDRLCALDAVGLGTS